MVMVMDIGGWIERIVSGQIVVETIGRSILIVVVCERYRPA